MYAHDIESIIFFFATCFFIYSLWGPSADMFFMRLSFFMFSFCGIIHFIDKIQKKYYLMRSDDESHYSQISYKRFLYDNRFDFIGILFVLIISFFLLF